MKLEELQEEAKEDAKLDQNHLADAAIKHTDLMVKWLKYLGSERLPLKSFENDFKKLFKSKYLYYSGRADAEVYKAQPFDLKVMKTELDKFIDADQDIIQSKLRIDLQSEKVEFIEGFLKTMHTRSYNIRAAIDFLKFKNGMM